jgi:hypothetical protein
MSRTVPLKLIVAAEANDAAVKAAITSSDLIAFFIFDPYFTKVVGR